MRKLNFSYWQEEIPTSEEYHKAVKNLELHNNYVDIVISHTAPREIIRRMGKYPDAHDIELTGFLEWVMYQVKFQHWHIDKNTDDKFTAVYFDVHALK